MTKRDECLKALQCLYLEVDATIADDVKRRVLEALDEANKNFVQPDVSGRSELLFAFITEVKKEFADQNWDYLDFIAKRVLKANNSH